LREKFIKALEFVIRELAQVESPDRAGMFHLTLFGPFVFLACRRAPGILEAEDDPRRVATLLGIRAFHGGGLHCLRRTAFARDTA
jgi:hypothetical protein